MAKKQSNSRTARWARACGEAREAFDKVQAKRDEIEGKIGDLVAELNDELGPLQDALNGILDVQCEYQEWYENMPDGLRNGAAGEKLQTITDFEVEYTIDQIGELPEPELDFSALDEVDNLIGECESAELPVGFGRD